jgi:hypothetical protein
LAWIKYFLYYKTVQPFESWTNPKAVKSRIQKPNRVRLSDVYCTRYLSNTCSHALYCCYSEHLNSQQKIKNFFTIPTLGLALLKYLSTLFSNYQHAELLLKTLFWYKCEKIRIPDKFTIWMVQKRLVLNLQISLVSTVLKTKKIIMVKWTRLLRCLNIKLVFKWLDHLNTCLNCVLTLVNYFQVKKQTALKSIGVQNPNP